MDKYDEDALKLLIEKTKKKLLILQTIPSDAKLIYTSQGENIVAFETKDGERHYI